MSQRIEQELADDEIAAWRRHPGTRWLLAQIGGEATLQKYREGTSEFDFGRARGFDEGMRHVGRLIAGR